MDKANALQRLAAAGILVSPAVAAAASAQQLEQLLTQKQGQLVVTELPDVAPATVSAEPLLKVAQLTVPEMVAAYQRKFTALRDLLLRRVDAVSLRMAATSNGPVSCIGMVRRLTAVGVELEDTTGLLEATLPAGMERPAIDDVVALRGTMNGSVLHATELLLPDVPLPQRIAAAELTIRLGAEGIQPEGPLQCFTVAGMRVLAWQPAAPLTQQQAIAVLRKRWLPVRPSAGPKEPALLEPLPDIIWLRCEPAWSASYKGVTLVAAARATVDLRDRSVQF